MTKSEARAILQDLNDEMNADARAQRVMARADVIEMIALLKARGYDRRETERLVTRAVQHQACGLERYVGALWEVLS